LSSRCLRDVGEPGTLPLQDTCPSKFLSSFLSFLAFPVCSSDTNSSDGLNQSGVWCDSLEYPDDPQAYPSSPRPHVPPFHPVLPPLCSFMETENVQSFLSRLLPLPCIVRLPFMFEVHLFFFASKLVWVWVSFQGSLGNTSHGCTSAAGHPDSPIEVFSSAPMIFPKVLRFIVTTGSVSLTHPSKLSSAVCPHISGNLS